MIFQVFLVSLNLDGCYGRPDIWTVRLRQNDFYFSNGILKLIFLHENCIFIEISLKWIAAMNPISDKKQSISIIIGTDRWVYTQFFYLVLVWEIWNIGLQSLAPVTALSLKAVTKMCIHPDRNPSHCFLYTMMTSWNGKYAVLFNSLLLLLFYIDTVLSKQWSFLHHSFLQYFLDDVL